MSHSIFGTMMAGEAAASIAPTIAESIRESPRHAGPRITAPTISNVAGTKQSMMAGRPIFFMSLISRLNPARNKITISAISRSSEEIERILGSSRFSAAGPRMMPVMISPRSDGICSFLKIPLMQNPIRSISARLISMLFMK